MNERSTRGQSRPHSRGVEGRDVNQSNQIVFVVDDDPDIRTALQRLIRSVGIDVQTSPSSAGQAEWEQRPSTHARRSP